jgi:hypothetical protein
VPEKTRAPTSDAADTKPRTASVQAPAPAAPKRDTDGNTG